MRYWNDNLYLTEDELSHHGGKHYIGLIIKDTSIRNGDTYTSAGKN